MRLTKKLLFIAAMCLCLTSCLEIYDETEINENGSGQFSLSMDMSQLLDMMQVMGGEEFEKRKDEKIDSVIYIKDMLDEAKNLTAEQKSLLRRGKVNVKMDLAAKEFKIHTQYPFDNLGDLQKLNTYGVMNIGDIMKDVGPGAGQSGSGKSSPEMDALLQVFDYKISNGLIKRSVNAARLKTLLNDPKMAEIKSGSEMGIEIPYKVVYKLPRPVKKVDNDKVSLSASKKVATLQVNLMELFTNAEKFAFTIEY